MTHNNNVVLSDIIESDDFVNNVKNVDKTLGLNNNKKNNMHILFRISDILNDCTDPDLGRKHAMNMSGIRIDMSRLAFRLKKKKKKTISV